MSTVNVEVAYAEPEQQWVLSVCIKPGSTIGEAISSSGLLEQVPTLNLSTLTVGIFSQRAGLETQLEGGERIEIYRPLQIDPKQKRKLNAKA